AAPAVEGEQLRPADQAARVEPANPLDPDPAGEHRRPRQEAAPRDLARRGRAAAALPHLAPRRLLPRRVQDLPRRRRRRLVGSPAAGQTGARSLRPVRPGALRRSIAVAASRPKWPACAITTD